MPAEQYIMGLFPGENQAAKAVKKLAETPWQVHRVHTPIPSHKIAKALNVKKSLLGWFTLTGGITGFFFGFLFAIFTATRWDLMVSGKPVVALVPFFIVGFEFTVLFAVIGNVIGLLTQMRLPRIKISKHYDPSCSGDRFGVLAVCRDGNPEGLKSFFHQLGGEVKQDAP